MVTDLTYKRNGIHHPSDFNANQRFPITEKHCFGVLIHNLIKLIFYEHDNGSVKDNVSTHRSNPERAYCSNAVLMLGQRRRRWRNNRTALGEQIFITCVILMQIGYISSKNSAYVFKNIHFCKIKLECPDCVEHIR